MGYYMVEQCSTFINNKGEEKEVERGNFACPICATTCAFKFGG